MKDLKDYQKQILEDLKQKEKLVLALRIGAGKAKIKDGVKCYN
jgi:superfamily II DNA or RNA helicase